MQVDSGASVLRALARPAAFGRGAEPFRRISPLQLRSLASGAAPELSMLLLDLRDADAFEAARVAGAVSYPAIKARAPVLF